MSRVDDQPPQQPHNDEPVENQPPTTLPTEPVERLSAHDPYAALRYRSFRLLLTGTFTVTMGEQMINVAIGWELYERTNSALALGLVGLVQIIPVILLSLPAGQLADRYNRKRIVQITLLVLSLASLGLALLSYTHGPLVLFYLCLLLIGIAAAFNGPASTTLVPLLVPANVYGNAATWTSSSWQLASVLGPALAGLIIALLNSASVIYVINALAVFVFVFLLALLPNLRAVRLERGSGKESTTIGSLVEGLSFLRHSQVILAAITLDMFAVLLGGAVTLLPIFARDILHVGPTGLGWMRAAPSIGAVCVAFLTAHRPPFKHSGVTLLLAVAGFGAATIVLGFSRFFLLSLLMLFALGGLDNISVVIRSTLLMVRTPDAMRGRVSAVNQIFVGASNQLGGFESGLAAQLFGPTLAVVGGGLGTLLVVLCVALLAPEMRRLRSLQTTNAGD